MQEFNYNYVENIYGNSSRLLFPDTDSLMYEIKTEDIYEDFSKYREMFVSNNQSGESKCHDASNKLVNGKIKNDISVSVKELVGLKQKMYLFLVDFSVEHKKAKGANKNAAATISHNKYKNVLLNKKCLRHSMNRILSKTYRIETY